MSAPAIHDPAVPAPGDGEPSAADIPVRFEDVAQDGRMLLHALLPGLGATCWRTLTRLPLGRRLLGGGVIPILSRLVLEGGEDSFGIAAPMRAEGRYDLAHVVGKTGAVDRLLLAMWLEVTAPISRTYGPPPDRAGEQVFAGRVYAEHTLTRLFAEPGQRRVTSIEVESAESVPPRRLDLVPLEAVCALPAGATWIEEAPSADAAPIVFGLSHTDSNQHVNSLVYVRVFEEAVLRGAARLGRPGLWLMRRAHVAFRKPCFAGEQYRVTLRHYERDGRLGAVGTLEPMQPDGATAVRPHVYLAVEG